MNKTIAVNISGIMFNIEEDAYAKLKSYLDTIKNYFQNADGSDEIMGDIESRIAELFQEKITEQNQVVKLKDVNEVIEVMGQPEAYASADMEFETFEGEGRSRSTHKKRRVFRDPDSKVIGGVCSGIGHYFGWDPLWLRIFFAVIFLTGGFGLIAYILLWIIIPKAKTTAEKLEMTGDPVTVENIKKKVSEGLSNFSEGVDNFANKVSDIGGGAARKAESTGGKFIDFLETLFKGFFRIAGKILGFLFLLGGLVALVTIAYALLDPTLWTWGNLPFQNGLSFSSLEEIVFNSSEQYMFIFTGIALILLIPIVLIIYGGMKLLFNFQTHMRGFGIIMFSLWILGFVITAFAGFSLGKEFFEERNITQEIELERPNADTLFLNLNNDVHFSNYFEGHHRDDNYLELLKIDNDQIILGNPVLRIHESKNDSVFSLEIRKSGRASSYAQSISRAENINYHLEQVGNHVSFDPFYSFQKDDKLRGQQVYITLYVPVGKSIYLGPLMDRIIYNVKNTSNTYDGDMVKRTWTMTEEGLTDKRAGAI